MKGTLKKDRKDVLLLERNGKSLKTTNLVELFEDVVLLQFTAYDPQNMQTQFLPVYHLVVLS